MTLKMSRCGWKMRKREHTYPPIFQRVHSPDLDTPHLESGILRNRFSSVSVLDGDFYTVYTLYNGIFASDLTCVVWIGIKPCSFARATFVSCTTDKGRERDRERAKSTNVWTFACQSNVHYTCTYIKHAD